MIVKVIINQIGTGTERFKDWEKKRKTWKIDYEVKVFKTRIVDEFLNFVHAGEMQILAAIH